MKLRHIFTSLLVVAMLLGLASFASATSTKELATTSGTLTVTYFDEEKGIKRVSLACTTDSGGRLLTDDIRISGTIARITIDPTSTMTDNWDFTLGDEAGIDLTYGAGANHDTTTSEQIVYNGNSGVYDVSTLTQTVDTDSIIIPWSPAVQDNMTLTILNAGNAKTVTIVLYVLQE
jgi:hypothetical protein